VFMYLIFFDHFAYKVSTDKVGHQDICGTFLIEFLCFVDIVSEADNNTVWVGGAHFFDDQ
jgi:hypothetical protein